MRRSLCLCDSRSLLAGDTGTWHFRYQTAQALPKGARLRFDFQSQGREMDWQLPRVRAKDGSNIIYGKYEEGSLIHPKEVLLPNKLIPQYEFTLTHALEVGESFSIFVGAAEGKKEAKGNRCQTYAQRRRTLAISVDAEGKGNFSAPDFFSIDIKGNKLHNIRVLAPSFVFRNHRFDIVLRFEDEFGNLTHFAPEGTQIEFSHTRLRDNLKWTLFVPETGFVALPSLYFNEEGTYRFHLKNIQSGDSFVSSPIRCFHEEGQQLFWGLLHGESTHFDATEKIESCLRHFRDTEGFNFYASSSPGDASDMDPKMWNQISQQVSSFNETERFTSFLGIQWKGESPREGLRHLLFNKDDKPLVRRQDGRYSTLKKLYNAFQAKEMISIPSFTMSQEHGFDFSSFNPDYERLVEIYNAWGSSESDKNNPLPISAGKKRLIYAEGSIQKALAKNLRFGFVAGGLDDRGPYENLCEGKQTQYTAGLTGIIASQFSRDSFFEALYQRSCYATTGEKIILNMEIAGLSMGSELNTEEKPGLIVNRHLTIYASGTQAIRSLEVICNGKVLHSFSSKEKDLEVSYDDARMLQGICFEKGKGERPFSYYYLRLTQEDGHMAWTSPIWIDYTPSSLFDERKTTRK